MGRRRRTLFWRYAHTGIARESGHPRQRASRIFWRQRAEPRMSGRSCAFSQAYVCFLIRGDIILDILPVANGISIPASYSAHIAPVSSSMLFNQTQARGEASASETPYVVMLHAINILSADGGGVSGNCGPHIQECWEYEHPRKDVLLDARGTLLHIVRMMSTSCAKLREGLPFTNSHNARSSSLTFHIPHAGILHGLAGYFEAVLYGKVGLSIRPDRMTQISRDMTSWFPILFPLKVSFHHSSYPRKVTCVAGAIVSAK